MSETHETFTVHVEHLQGFEFKLRYDWPGLDETILDEPEPLGHEKGPNASRLVAAAVGNCLAASLLFCLNKSRVPPRSLKADVTGSMVRSEKGRMRIGGIQVRLQVDPGEGQAPRLKRCLDLFEDYCVVTASIRGGIPVQVEVVDQDGAVLRASAEH
jgi:uncharacterized OsmC-like protein